MLHALSCVPAQDLFDRDPSESRRTVLKGERLLPVFVAYQLARDLTEPAWTGSFTSSEMTY